MTAIHLVWFRQDLRLRDNPAWQAAARLGPVLPVYILDDLHPGDWKLGAASRWWLHHSLLALNQALDNRLWVLAGDPLHLLAELTRRHQVAGVYWNRCYEPWQIARDRNIKTSLEQQGVAVTSYQGSLLWEPWQNLKDDGTPYRVFTAFYRNGLRQGVNTGQVLADKPPVRLVDCTQPEDKLAGLKLLPRIPWYADFPRHFRPGEAGAQQQLQGFIAAGLGNYKAGRDYPALGHVSRLSPHLHFGEIAPHRVWQAAQTAAQSDGLASDAAHFQRELVWREFSHALLYHFPTLTETNLNPRFNAFPWQDNDQWLGCWQRGETGYPLVDAGMRELWTTGYMHNRVRMVVGSFLVKNLLLHWQHGARWFWDCLLDADLPNNTCSWQWVAGCGADAAPYFRIFNPLSQSQKFRAETYIRRYLPALAQLPDQYIHQPATAPALVLEAAGIRLDKHYPRPIVALQASRERALAAWRALG